MLPLIGVKSDNEQSGGGSVFTPRKQIFKKPSRGPSGPDPKRRKCPDELRYEDGDHVIVDKWGRRRGSSVALLDTIALPETLKVPESYEILS